MQEVGNHGIETMLLHPGQRALPLELAMPKDGAQISPDDADPDEAEDPYQSEDYQRYVAECAKHCECSPFWSPFWSPNSEQAHLS